MHGNNGHTGTPYAGDDEHLRALGYEPRFERKINLRANFALGFLYLSPMVGVVSLFALGMTKAGPPSIFWIVIVGIGMLLVALVFGEIVSQFPIAGGLYQWTRRLLSGRAAWWMSWIYIGAITIGVTTTSLFSSGFVASLIFGTEENPSVAADPGMTAIIALAVVAIGLIVNLTGSKSLARISQIALAGELVGVIGVGLYLMIFQRKQDFGVFFDSMGAGGGGNYVGVFIGASLVGLYLFYGFEACGEVAEETPSPARTIPRSMALTVIIGGLASMFAFAGYVLAAPNLAEIVAGDDANPIPSILQGTLGTVGMKVFLVIILISFLAGVMGQQTASSRLIFSFARDRMFPGGHVIARTAKRSHTPVNALLIANLMPVVIIVYVFFSPDALPRIAAFQMLAGYFAFAIVVFAALRARTRGWKPAGPFTLGSAGTLVNVLALAYLVFGMVILASPASDPTLPWYDRWIALIGFVVVAGTGLVYLLVAKPERHSDAPEGDAIAVSAAMRGRSSTPSVHR
jgi:amino acid transporter